MTDAFFHPSILFIAGAFLIPLLWGKVQKAYLLIIPAIAFLICIGASQGTYGVYNFLGHEIIFAKIDKLSLVFSYIFTIMAFIGMMYGLHDKDPGHDWGARCRAVSGIIVHIYEKTKLSL